MPVCLSSTHHPSDLCWLHDRPIDLDPEEFALRVSTDSQLHEALVQWVVDLAYRMLQEPNPRLLTLELKYNPQRELALIAKRYGITQSEMDNLSRM